MGGCPCAQASSNVRGNSFAGNRPGDLWDPLGLTAQSTPNGDRMPSQSPEPCVTNCETRDGRDRLDSFDPRTDREKINDALEQVLRDPCDSSMASCPEPGNPLSAFEGSSNVLTHRVAETDRYELYQRKLQVELDRDAVQSVPSPTDFFSGAGVVRSARTATTALQELNAAKEATRAYSVAFETTLQPLAGGAARTLSRAPYFKAANEALLLEMRANAGFAQSMEHLGIHVPSSSTGAALGRSPAGWTWHHVPNRPGVMQLVPRSEHQGGAWQPLFHPGGVGGFKVVGS
jgi:hypothetical protein